MPKILWSKHISHFFHFKRAPRFARRIIAGWPSKLDLHLIAKIWQSAKSMPCSMISPYFCHLRSCSILLHCLPPMVKSPNFGPKAQNFLVRWRSPFSPRFISFLGHFNFGQNLASPNFCSTLAPFCSTVCHLWSSPQHGCRNPCGFSGVSAEAFEAEGLECWGIMNFGEALLIFYTWNQ